MGKHTDAAINSFKKNPLENLATGGMVGLHKGIMAGGLPQIFPGANKVKGADMSPDAVQYENEMLARQAAIARGEGNNPAADDAMRAAMSTAASARGIANPMLAQRAAQNVVAEQGMAQMGHERRLADQMIAQQAAAQRGVAMQGQIANQQADAAYRGQNMNMISGLGTGAMALASDENGKKDISRATNAGDDVETFVNALKGYDFKYKNPEAPGADHGPQMGVMAQDLEKSQTGAQAVIDTPDGKMVDYAKLIPAMAAAIAEQNQKLKKMEGKKS